jgi:hypothetical protein
VRWKVNKIDKESNDYMRRAEKKCRKIKNGCIPFSPEGSIWIRRRQVYESLLWQLQHKIRNWSNLRRTAQRCGIQRPFCLKKAELKERLKVCEEKCKYYERHGQQHGRRICRGDWQWQESNATTRLKDKYWQSLKVRGEGLLEEVKLFHGQEIREEHYMGTSGGERWQHL